MHEQSWFVTLTYDDDHLPPTGSLEPPHLRDFWKRLRERLFREFWDQRPWLNWREARRDWPGISYYACGEYGPQTDRPHYHAILFGCDFPDRVQHRYDDAGRPVFLSEFLTDTWQNGNVEFTGFSAATAAYVSGYVQKKVESQNDPDYYLRYDPETGELHQLVPEFSRMSRRPAVGRRWIEKYWREVYPRDEVVVNGFPQKPPRYYDRWAEQRHLDKDGRETCPGGCFPHLEALYEAKLNRWDPDRDDSPEKLEAKRKIHEARLGLKPGKTKL